MLKKNLLLAMIAGAATLGAIGCDDDPSDPTPSGDAIDTLVGETGAKAIVIDPGEDNTIYISGYYRISPGGSLEIPAGTTVIGLPIEETGEHAAIIASRGDGTNPSGKLIAKGTASSPIVFTSKATTKGRGQWGGIVLLGNSTLNLDGNSGEIEGTGGSYGWGGSTSAAVTNDNSGTLEYVRVEFGGVPITADNEINGITFGSVGSGTKVEHVQSHMIADDGFEWFGGTVNGKYLVSSGNDDDGFDMDFGYSGNLQFLFVMQDPALANRGFEIDNNGSNNTATPYTSATVANVTIVGAGVDKTPAGEDNDGFYLRRGNRLKIWNAISTNFRYAMMIDGKATSDNVQAGELYVKNSILHGRTGAYGIKSAEVADYLTLAAGWNNVLEDPMLRSLSFSNPDPRPNNPKAAGIGSVPNNGYFDQVSYAGAFDPAATSLWFAGWTSWSKN